MDINGKTRTMGLLGNPVEHTLSPVIHNSLNQICNRNGVYVPFLVEPDGLEAAVKGAYELNVLGLNVTVPHKVQVMDALVDIDSAARGIGAVNTLVREEVRHGYVGYNTDMPGLLRAVRSEGIELRDRTIVILGAGGASKAVAYMCMQEKAQHIYMLNRTISKAEHIADHMNQLFGRDTMQAWRMEDYAKLPDEKWIVFQCTSIGLSPNVNQVVLEDAAFYQHVEVGVDLIYNPAQTRFMKLVTQAGGQAYNGLKMLLYQGIIAYELWNQISVTTEQAELVYDHLYESIHPSGDNIVLTGFMGSGKTTVGHALERMYGYHFIDTDAYIEEAEGMSIPEIFDRQGEAYFRQIETRALQHLVETAHHAVVSTGGGMPLRRENARLLRELGQVWYLQVSEDGIWERVKNSHGRPLLECENPRNRIHMLMEERHPRYMEAARYYVKAENRTPEDIAKEIHAQKEWA
jgi:shikimate dehydrogenase